MGRVGISSHLSPRGPASSHETEVIRIISAPFSTSFGIHTHLRCPGILLSRKRWSRNRDVFDRYIIAVTPLVCFASLSECQSGQSSIVLPTELWAFQEAAFYGIHFFPFPCLSEQGRAQQIMVAGRTRTILRHSKTLDLAKQSSVNQVCACLEDCSWVYFAQATSVGLQLNWSRSVQSDWKHHNAQSACVTLTACSLSLFLDEATNSTG